VTARLGAGILAALSLVATLVSGFAFFHLYWYHRSCFDENGRCFVPEDGSVYSADSFVLAPLAVIFGMLFVVGSLYAGRR
jgi:hypothetical protein